MDKADTTAALVARLVAQQFPQWAHLEVRPVEVDGWDNTKFRLGDELSARLPSGDDYVAQVDKEHRWLPVLAEQLPLRIPEPVAKGRPGFGYARPWSVYRWIDGETANMHRLDDVGQCATDLAGFLNALYVIDPTGGPAAGSHNFHRGGSLATYEVETLTAIERLDGEIDSDAALDVWRSARTTEWSRPPVWVHGDITPSNLLVAGGRLSAVIDFGCAGVGDPACDLVMAWTFFAGDSRRTFQSELRLDEATWARGRGWALWKALITIDHSAVAANDFAQRFGWRNDAHQVIQEILADHREAD